MPDAVQHDWSTHLARFGLTGFRPGQREVIEAVLSGADCLCIMPTGGGKSLCYQLPAVARPGVTLVISPLIALMKDQVDGLCRQGVRATFINSALTPAEQGDRLAGMAQGAFELVYIAPERLRSPRFRDTVREAGIRLLAVDEAHCISQWGHDFRPDYARIGQFREGLGMPPTIALTATATPLVRSDVIQQLKLRSPQTFITGFARDNLFFEVQLTQGRAEKDAALLSVLEETPGAGIIYASTRKRCEELVEWLATEIPRRVQTYHAGLEFEERRLVQEAFMSGTTDIIVATNAFGMGIDKPNLRFVVHYNMPGSLEAYYQEAGRAGRDGQPSRCVLLFSSEDRYIQEFFIDNEYPPKADLRKVYEFLRKQQDDPIQISLGDLKQILELSLSTQGIAACERILEKCGALLRLETGQNQASFKLDSDFPTLVDLLPREARVQRRVLQAIEQAVGSRRYEWVSVAPHRLAATAEVDRDAFNRAIRELSRLEAFDYLPPFRGRAIRVTDRSVPFERLSIDFAELDRRKGAEYEKLERVVRYARARRCRQWEILDYFGDPAKAACGHCDNCPRQQTPSTGQMNQPAAHQTPAGLSKSRLSESSPSPANSSPSPETVEAVRMALSGVARARERVGKGLVAKMLKGSRSEKVRQLGLSQLSTFGLLADLKQHEVSELLDALIELGLLRMIDADRDRPRIGLTPLGTQIMLGHATLTNQVPVSSSLRRQLENRRLRHSPGTIDRPSVASPSLPKNETDQLEPQAVYPSVVTTLAHAEREPGSFGTVPVRGNSAATAAVPPNAPRPSYVWTWELFQRGFDRDACMEIRGIDEGQLVDHLLQCLEQPGLGVEPHWVLSPPVLAVLERVVGETPPERLRPLLDELPPEIRYEHVLLFVRCRTQATPQPSEK